MAHESFVVFDGHGESFFGADDDDPLFAAGDAGVEQVAVEEFEMGCVDWHDNARTFAALVFVDGNGIGEDELVELVESVGDGVVIEGDGELLVDGVDRDDAADIAVEDAFVVVVANLHDFVAKMEVAAHAS